MNSSQDQASHHADLSRHDAVRELRDALRGVLNTCKATNQASDRAGSLAEAAYLATLTAAEKAAVVVIAKRWQREEALGFYQTIELNGFEDVVHRLGAGLLHRFVTESHVEPAADAVAVSPPPPWFGDVPSDRLKSQVLHGWGKSVTALPGHTYLTAKQEKRDRIIVVVDGKFDRRVFKTAIAEARSTGAMAQKIQVYCHIATYTGAGIEIVKYDDLGRGDLDLKPRVIELPVHGIVVTLHHSGGGSVTSSLREENEPEEVKVGFDAMMAMIIQHAIAGVDVTTASYAEGIDSAVRNLSRRIVTEG